MDVEAVLKAASPPRNDRERRGRLKIVLLMKVMPDGWTTAADVAIRMERASGRPYSNYRAHMTIKAAMHYGLIERKHILPAHGPRDMIQKYRKVS